MPIDPRSIMQQDPRILERIANPTGGKLTQLGSMYNQGQQDIQKMQMLKEEQGAKMADISSKLMKGFTNSVMEKYKATPGADIKQIQVEQMQSAPPQFQQMLGKMLSKPFGDIDQVRQVNTRATEMQKALHPEQYETDAPDAFTLGQGQQRFDAAGTPIAQVAPRDSENNSSKEMASIQNKKTGEIQTRIKGDPYIATQIATNEWIKYSPSTGGTSADANELTTKTYGNLEDASVKAAEMQDRIGNLVEGFDDKYKDKLGYWSRINDSVLGFSENLGIPLTEGGKKDIQDRESLKNETSKLYTSWRLFVTGSQAGKYELAEIKSQPPNPEMSETQFKQSLILWKDDADRMAVRSLRAQEQNFSPTGSIKLGNGREVPVWTNRKTGEVRAISDFGALGDIPTMDEYVDDALTASYPDPSKLSPQQQRQALEDARNQARKLGYR